MLVHVVVEMSRIPELPLLSNLSLQIETRQGNKFGMERLIWTEGESY